MKALSGPPELAALRRHWALWTAVVELFAQRSRARRRLDPGEYGALHHDLLAACRALADTADKRQRAFYQQLEELVRPWLNLQVLEAADWEILYDLLGCNWGSAGNRRKLAADWEILYDLLGRCQEAGRQLRARRLRRPWPLWVVLLLAGSSMFAFLLWSADRLRVRLLELASEYGYALKRAIAQLPEEYGLAPVGAAALLLAFYLVMRVSRT